MRKLKNSELKDLSAPLCCFLYMPTGKPLTSSRQLAPDLGNGAFQGPAEEQTQVREAHVKIQSDTQH